MKMLTSKMIIMNGVRFKILKEKNTVYFIHIIQ